MPSSLLKQRVLAILAQKVIQTDSPDLTDVFYLSEQLGLSVKKTRELLRSMEGLDMIESSVDCDFALITRAGLSRTGVTL